MSFGAFAASIFKVAHHLRNNLIQKKRRQFDKLYSAKKLESHQDSRNL